MKRRSILLAVLGLAGVGVTGGCPQPPPPTRETPRPTTTVEVGSTDVLSGEEGYRELYLTVMPNDLALVRERRQADLPAGVSAVSYLDVVDSVIPESTRVRFYPQRGESEDVQFLEQRYRYDLIEPMRLTELSLGGTVRMKWTQVATGVERVLEGVVESTEQGLFLRTPDGSYTLATPTGEGWYSRAVLDDLPGALFSRPLLDWIVDVRRGGPGVLETSYLCSGFSWEADYVITASEDFEHADLLGWVTLRNNTGGRFEKAHLAVVAGDIHMAPADYGAYTGYAMGMMAAEGDGDGDYGYVEEGLFEYHLYKLNEPSTLPAYSWKQVSFIDRTAIAITTMYEASVALQIGGYGAPVGTDDAVPSAVNRVLTIENRSETDGLGVPLPAGTARVYARSGEDLFFIDATQVDDTPREEPLEVQAGGAPFLVVKSKATDVSQSDAGRFGSYTVVRHEVTAVNRGSRPVTLRLRLAMPGADYPGGYGSQWDARLQRAPGSDGPPLEEIQAGVWEEERVLEPDVEVKEQFVLRIRQTY